MKKKITKKEINNRYNTIIKLGYCEAHYLLSFKKPSYYTAGVYGWNADVYIIDNVAIVTGYSPFGNIKPDYDTVKNYENQAAGINCDYDLNYETKEIMTDELLSRFIKKALNV